jgi:catechol 2,3-dioxygenase
MGILTGIATQPSPAIDPPGIMGRVHLGVAGLDREIAFYCDAVGLKLHWRDGNQAGLSAGGEDLLRLSEVRDGRRPRGTTGLYHFAILLPDRRELARVIGRLLSLGIANYPTDHVITKSTYLGDPEGNGIEIYVESPEDGTAGIVDGRYVVRRADGMPSDGRDALDAPALLRELAPGERLDAPMPTATRIGHVHLHVADLDTTMRFYCDVLGFDDQGIARDFQMGMVSAGGYHHHIGFNTWACVGAPSPPPGALGLRYFAVKLPDESGLARVVARVQRVGIAADRSEEGWLVRDPSHNGVLLTAGAIPG